IAVTRARMCELLAARGHNASGRDGGSAFIVGLLSLLDVLLEIPMDVIISRIELAADVRFALLHRGGPLAQPLRIVEAYERGDWVSAQTLIGNTKLETAVLPELYFDSLQWATERLAG